MKYLSYFKIKQKANPLDFSFWNDTKWGSILHEIMGNFDDPTHLNYKYSVWNLFIDTKESPGNKNFS